MEAQHLPPSSLPATRSYLMTTCKSQPGHMQFLLSLPTVPTDTSGQAWEICLPSYVSGPSEPPQLTLTALKTLPLIARILVPLLLRCNPSLLYRSLLPQKSSQWCRNPNPCPLHLLSHTFISPIFMFLPSLAHEI